MKLDIVKLARQADALAEQKETDKEWVQDFANLIIEECAKVCLRGDNEYSNGIECAAKIREMKSE